MTTIRPLLEDDVPAIVDALDGAENCAWNGDRLTLVTLLAAALESHAGAQVAISPSGQLRGLAILAASSESSDVELALVWVAPEMRQRSLGRALLSSLAPVWANRNAWAAIPPKAYGPATRKLLTQFGFTATPGTTPELWKARRVRRSTGRTSLAHMTRRRDRAAPDVVVS